jgi:peroxin-11B
MGGMRSDTFKVLLASLQDSLDILIPASALDFIKLEAGTVGLAGTVTSLLGGYAHWTSL